MVVHAGGGCPVRLTVHPEQLAPHRGDEEVSGPRHDHIVIDDEKPRDRDGSVTKTYSGRNNEDKLC